MFCAEARIQAGLSHPNVVEVLDFGELDGCLFMALEYVDGLTCGALMEGMLNRRRTVDAEVVVYIVTEVLRGLAYLHGACDDRGLPLCLVHRDIAPNNVLLGTVGEVKIADFGIAFSRIKKRSTVPGEIRGKVGYISPEQARGEAVDGRSDLFSLAVMAAEMLTGKALFQGDSVPEVLGRLNSGDLSILRTYGGHVPPDLRGVLVRGLEVDRDRRYPDANAFADALAGVAARHGFVMGAYGFAEWMADLGLISLKSTVSVVPPRR
jgi:serine/threonine-protein kinase